MQKVAITNDAATTLNPTVTVGNNVADVYKDSNYLNFNMQLTSVEDITTDVAPNSESNGLSWRFYGAKTYAAFGLGAVVNSTYCNNFNTIVNQKGIDIVFNKNSNGTVSPKAPCNTEMTDRASASTLTQIGGDDGVYFRLRSYVEQTYVITLKSPDIKAPSSDEDEPPVTPDPDTPQPPTPPAPEKENSYDGKFKDYLYVSENGVVDEAETKIRSGKATLKITVAPGGYFQYLQKLTDLVGGQEVKIYVGDSTIEDYQKTNFNVQLTTDAAAKRDIIPVNENIGEDPGVNAITFRLAKDGADNTEGIYLNNGGYGGGQVGPISLKNTEYLNGGLRLTFKKFSETDSRILAKFAIFEKTSLKTLEEIGGEDGVYLRLRNSSSTATTFTVIIKSDDVQPLVSPAYKDGNWIFSSEESTSVLQESKEEKGIFSEKLTAVLAPDGYVQFDKKLAYLIGNSKANINIVVGDGKTEDYESARVQIQLTADAEAKTDIIPVDERYDDPGIKGMTWLFYGQTGRMWTGRGSNTGGGGYYCGPDLIATMHNGLRIKFNNEEGKVSYGTTVGGLTISNTLPSTKTLEEIGGMDGVYVRLRNAATETVTYTITIQYTNGIIESAPVTQKGWTVKGETEGGVQVADEIDEVLPGFRAWNFTIPENTYAQYNTKITDLKDASFRFDTGEYDKYGYTTSFAFVTDPDAPWDPKKPDGNIKKFTIFIRPSSDPENTHIAFCSGTVLPGKSNATPTIRALSDIETHKGESGFSLSFVEVDGHWYLSVGSFTIRGDDVLEQYLRMDEFVEKGAYLRVYAESNGETYMYPQVSISSKVVPPIGSDEEDNSLTDDEKMLKEFLDYFTDNIDALRKADMKVVNKVAEMWKALSYLNQSNVEAYFIDEDEVYNLIQAIKAYANFEATPDEVEWITTYTTIFTTSTGATDDNNSTTRKKVIRRKLKNGGYDFPIEIIIVISAVVVFVVAGGVTFFVIRKKRKNKTILPEV